MSLDKPLVPLMSPAEIERLSGWLDRISSDGIAIEYGAGGSTPIWASLLSTPSQRLYVVEHVEPWAWKVREAILDDRVVVYYAAVSEPGAYATPAEELPIHVDKYIDPPCLESAWDRVDWILADGIARGACLAAARVRCRPGTKVFLHDYAGREWWYSWAVDLYPPECRHITESLLELTVPDL